MWPESVTTFDFTTQTLAARRRSSLAVLREGRTIPPPPGAGAAPRWCAGQGSARAPVPPTVSVSSWAQGPSPHTRTGRWSRSASSGWLLSIKRSGSRPPRTPPATHTWWPPGGGPAMRREWGSWEDGPFSPSPGLRAPSIMSNWEGSESATPQPDIWGWATFHPTFGGSATLSLSLGGSATLSLSFGGAQGLDLNPPTPAPGTGLYSGVALGPGRDPGLGINPSSSCLDQFLPQERGSPPPRRVITGTLALGMGTTCRAANPRAGPGGLRAQWLPRPLSCHLCRLSGRGPGC